MILCFLKVTNGPVTPIQSNLDLNVSTVCWHCHFCLSLLDNSDLIACMVVSKDGGQAQRFLAVDVYQMSLVEPETKRLGWGVVKFAGLLQVREKCCDHVCVAVLCAKNVQSLKSIVFYTSLCLSSSHTCFVFLISFLCYWRRFIQASLFLIAYIGVSSFFVQFLVFLFLSFLVPCFPSSFSSIVIFPSSFIRCLFLLFPVPFISFPSEKMLEIYHERGHTITYLPIPPWYVNAYRHVWSCCVVVSVYSALSPWPEKLKLYCIFFFF